MKSKSLSKDFTTGNIPRQLFWFKLAFCSNRPETPYEVYWNYEAGVNSSLKRKQWRRLNYQHKNNGKLRHMKKRKLKDL